MLSTFCVLIYHTTTKYFANLQCLCAVQSAVMQTKKSCVPSRSSLPLCKKGRLQHKVNATTDHHRTLKGFATNYRGRSPWYQHPPIPSGPKGLNKYRTNYYQIFSGD